MSNRDPRPISEAAVLKAVKQLLEARGFRVWRRNTRVVKFTYTSKRTGKTKEQLVRYGLPGMADLWGWRLDGPGKIHQAGRHIEVEIKRDGKAPTDWQALWLHQAKMEGCIAFWCDSTEMCEAKLKEWGL